MKTGPTNKESGDDSGSRSGTTMGRGRRTLRGAVGASLGSAVGHTVRTPGPWLFRRFCRLVLRVFYRRSEVLGLEHLPRRGPVMICGNHPNALVDAVILQALLPRFLHPLARSGLFRNPLLRPVLAAIGAVPVKRRQDLPNPEGKSGKPDGEAASGTSPEDRASADNDDAFARCYDLLGRGGTLLIFPEGESHSDASMRSFRTGAARIALGALARDGTRATVLPVGLSFSEVGRFRGSVFVNIAPPIPLPTLETSNADQAPGSGSPGEGAVRELTLAIQAGLETVTLNPASWRDLDLMRRIDRFFTLRRGHKRRRHLSERFRVLKKLIEAHNKLQAIEPERVERVRSRLRRFERLCVRAGVRDYQLSIAYTPALVTRYIARTLGLLLFLLPLGAWGWLNGIVPYRLTGVLASRLARGRYQVETAEISLGLLWFGLFWGVQTTLVQHWAGGWWAAAYLLSLPIAGGAALVVGRERERIVDNVRGFLVFFNKKDLRDLLQQRRRELERDLARLAQAAKRAG